MYFTKGSEDNVKNYIKANGSDKNCQMINTEDEPTALANHNLFFEEQNIPKLTLILNLHQDKMCWDKNQSTVIDFNIIT